MIAVFILGAMVGSFLTFCYLAPPANPSRSPERIWDEINRRYPDVCGDISVDEAGAVYLDGKLWARTHFTNKGTLVLSWTNPEDQVQYATAQSLYLARIRDGE